MDIQHKKKIMISFREGGDNGGPNNSHKRIVESNLKDKYEFIPFYIPTGHLGVFNYKVIKQLAKNIKANNPDIVHFTGLELVGWYGMLACKMAGVKNSLIAIHGSTSEAIEFNKNIVKKLLINIIEMLTLKNTKYAYGVSEYVGSWHRVKKYVNNYCGHIYNLPLLHKQTLSENTFRNEFEIAEQDIIIVSTGRIIKEKGFEILRNIINEGNWSENIHFVIVGEGNYLDEMKSTLKDIKCKVHFTGFRNDIDSILNASDIFVMCSLHETLCMSVEEASQNGLPVVASRVGGIPEIIEDGKSGFLANAGDANDFIDKIRILIEDSDLRKMQGECGRRIIKDKFNPCTITQSIDNVYKLILSGGNNE